MNSCYANEKLLPWAAFFADVSNFFTDDFCMYAQASVKFSCAKLTKQFYRWPNVEKVLYANYQLIASYLNDVSV